MTVIQDLPMGWAIASVGDVCSQPQYGYTTKASNSGDLRLLRTSDITPGRINWETVPYCSENPNDLEKYILKDGDILVSRAGIRRCQSFGNKTSESNFRVVLDSLQTIYR